MGGWGGGGERQTALEERDGKQRDTGEEKKEGVKKKPGEKAGDRGDKRRRR